MSIAIAMINAHLLAQHWAQAFLCCCCCYNYNHKNLHCAMMFLFFIGGTYAVIMIIASSLLQILQISLRVERCFSEIALNCLAENAGKSLVCCSSQEEILTPPKSHLHALHSCGSVYSNKR